MITDELWFNENQWKPQIVMDFEPSAIIGDHLLETKNLATGAKDMNVRDEAFMEILGNSQLCMTDHHSNWK